MTWPDKEDYNEAIQSLRYSMRDAELRAGEPALHPGGLPMLWSGHFAAVYKVHCPATGNTWALKCFTREVPGLHDRYRHITRHLLQARLPFMVEFQFLEQGIRVAGSWFPALKMGWVEGLTLDRFVEQHLDRPKTLRTLLVLWLDLAKRLRQTGVAHADLQHGNVLVMPMAPGKPVLRLVDYDGMYVPDLAGRHSGEVGHPAYQHPQRLRDGAYNAEVDRFSHLAIYCAIRCLLLEGRDLWERFNNADNLLFRESDFETPGTSELFQTLWESDDADCQALAGRLILACQAPLEQVALLEEVVADTQVLPLSAQEETAVNDILVAPKPPLTPVLQPEAAAAESAGERPWWVFSAPPLASVPIAAVPAAPDPSALVGTTPMPGVVAGQPQVSAAPAPTLAAAPTVATRAASGLSLPSRSSGRPRHRRIYPVLVVLLCLCSIAAVAGLPGKVIEMVSLRSGSRDDVPSKNPAPRSPHPLQDHTSTRVPEVSATEPPRRTPIPPEYHPTAPFTEVPIKAPAPSTPRPPPTPMPPFDAARAKAKEPPLPATTLTDNAFTLHLGRGVDLEMILIRSGSFMMGDGSGESDGKPFHKVTIMNNFYMGKYEVTQEQWEAVMGTNPSHLRGPQNPVENVSWDDCQAFLKALNQSFSALKGRLRLPTEAEWEYACRGGTTSKYSFGEQQSSLAQYAWFNTNSRDETHTVGGKKPNAWGLYDMHGNVMEWCADWYGSDYYKISPPADPTGPTSGSFRVLRGGSWSSYAGKCGAAYRNADLPASRSGFVGFRVVYAR